MIDPFSDEADPLRLDGSPPPSIEDRVAPPTGTKLGRRCIVTGLVVIPMAVTASACSHSAGLGTLRPAPPHRCAHRFCRHYRR